MFKWILDSYVDIFDVVLAGHVTQNRRKTGSNAVYRPVTGSTCARRPQSPD